MTPRSSELDALADALGAAARVRILSTQVWQMWTAAAPRLHGDPQQAAELAAALHVLSERGTIELPVDAWDRSTTPPLPRSVTVPAARKGQRTRPWATFSLVPATGLGVLTTDADPDPLRWNDCDQRMPGRYRRPGTGGAYALRVRRTVRR
jgi:hypothetical protein